MTRRRILALICFTLLCSSAHADIYAYTGSDGVIHLTNLPQHKEQYRLVMRTPKMATHIARQHVNPIARSELQPLVTAAAKQYGLSAALLNAVIRVESGFNPGAVSSKGAMGLMQLMPATASRFGVQNPFDAAENIRGGAAYLADLMRKFGGDLRLVLAAYNAGSQAVIQAGYHIPPFQETQNYVPEVMEYYQKFADGTPPQEASTRWIKPVIQISSP
ncbi:transglycosylase SLT domain-containing protein [Acidithiobacillus sp. AMEEHan]|uniref:transglycosylase SLT domain-containing protein n=1 Tax=Acidithiobacillus sp. AMEEHan TaxID=2994951 RepID=UPI0027E40B1B|nr:transglycosylase SLT domain-containing protein [Acidithiobacillus sp. AMEEHan]